MTQRSVITPEVRLGAACAATVLAGLYAATGIAQLLTLVITATVIAAWPPADSRESRTKSREHSEGQGARGSAPVTLNSQLSTLNHGAQESRPAQPSSRDARRERTP